MMLSSQKSLIRFEEATLSTMVIAMLRKDPKDFTDHPDIFFEEGYDELDYVSFATITLPSTRQIALLYHKRSPVQGIELCVQPNEPSVSQIIDETIQYLNLVPEDVLWTHPQSEATHSEKKG